VDYVTGWRLPVWQSRIIWAERAGDGLDMQTPENAVKGEVRFFQVHQLIINEHRKEKNISLAPLRNHRQTGSVISGDIVPKLLSELRNAGHYVAALIDTTDSGLHWDTLFVGNAFAEDLALTIPLRR